MDIKTEEILRRLYVLERRVDAVLRAVDISKLPEELQEKIISENKVKERIDEITLMNEWIEKDKQEIINYYSNKPLTKSEKNEAIYGYCEIGTERWWYVKKNEIRRTKLLAQRNKREDARRDLIRQETIATEQHQERDPDIKKERKKEIAANKLFE